MRTRTIWGAQLALVLLCALALKYFYSTASPNELRWILAPTTVLVELLSGKSFEFESYMGYMSRDHTFVIAAPCAGVNFLLTAFAMLSLRRLWRDRFQAVGWSFLPAAVVIAYTSTLIANTVRICVALQGIELSGLTRNQVHRLEGIAVYFGFLLLLFVVIERFDSAKSSIQRLALPLLIYYATTLGIPLVNGAFLEYPSFWEHFVFVLILPLILVLPAILWTRMTRKKSADFPRISAAGDVVVNLAAYFITPVVLRSPNGQVRVSRTYRTFRGLERRRARGPR